MRTANNDTFIERWQKLLGNTLSIDSDGTDDASGLGKQLKELVVSSSPKVYENTDELRNGLMRLGVDDITTFKLCLLVSVTGFGDLIEPDIRTLQTDINRVIVNAQNETGLNRVELMSLMRLVLLSLGIVFDYDAQKDSVVTKEECAAYVVPNRFYAKDIELIKRGIGQAEVSGEVLSNTVIDTLEPLVAAGIPKAQYLMGYCMLRELTGDEAQKKGLELVTKAAIAGDVEAAAELGDYYYRVGEDDESSDGWERALEYYTGFGSLALSMGRRERVINILNHAAFNKRTIALCVPLLFVMALLAFLSIGSPAYASHLVLGIVMVALCMDILVLALRSNKAKPYFSNYIVPVSIFVAWSLYMAVRLFFY